jgi:hypothetical protein
VLYGYLNFKRTTGLCSIVIWNLKEPWVGVVWIFEFWKNHGLVLYGYLILKEPRVSVAWLFGFWKNHGLVLYGYLKFERTMGWCCTVIWILKEPWVPAIFKNLWFFYERVSKEGVVLGSVIWRISKLMREPWSATRTGRLMLWESWIWISVARMTTAGGLFPAARTPINPNDRTPKKWREREGKRRHFQYPRVGAGAMARSRRAFKKTRSTVRVGLPKRKSAKKSVPEAVCFPGTNQRFVFAHEIQILVLFSHPAPSLSGFLLLPEFLF